MSTLLQVAQLGNSVLREKSKPIENVKDTKIQQLIDDLLETVIDVNGVGIAAPQVYQLYRIFIVASHPNPSYPHAPEMEPTAMINPKIIAHSDEKIKDWEGCLSIPGVRGLVPRFTSIEFEYTNRAGKKVTGEFTDFVARIFQHEHDHLEGIVFLDRTETTKDIVMEKEYLKNIKKQKETFNAKKSKKS